MLRQECKGFDDEGDCFGSEGDPYSCSVVRDDDGPLAATWPVPRGMLLIRLA